MCLSLLYVVRMKSRRTLPPPTYASVNFKCCLRTGALHETNNKTAMNDLQKRKKKYMNCMCGRKKTKRLALFMSFSDHLVCARRLFSANAQTRPFVCAARYALAPRDCAHPTENENPKLQKFQFFYCNNECAMLRSMFLAFEASEDEHTNRSQREERATERGGEMVNYYVETFKCRVCARLNMVRYDFNWIYVNFPIFPVAISLSV